MRLRRIPAASLKTAINLLGEQGKLEELVAAGGRPGREQREVIQSCREQLDVDTRISLSAPSALHELRLKAESSEVRAAVEWAATAQRRMQDIAVELGRGPLLEAAQRLVGEVNEIVAEAFRRAGQLGLGAGQQGIRGWLDTRGAVAVPIVEVASPEALISSIATVRGVLFPKFLKGLKNGNGNGHHGGA